MHEQQKMMRIGRGNINYLLNTQEAVTNASPKHRNNYQEFSSTVENIMVASMPKLPSLNNQHLSAYNLKK